MHTSAEGSQTKNVAIATLRQRHLSQASFSHMKAHDADKALPVSKIPYKEKKKQVTV